MEYRQTRAAPGVAAFAALSARARHAPECPYFPLAAGRNSASSIRRAVARESQHAVVTMPHGR